MILGERPEAYIVLGNYLDDDFFEAAGQCTLVRTPMDTKDIGRVLSTLDLCIVQGRGSEAIPEILKYRYGVDIMENIPRAVPKSKVTADKGDAFILVKVKALHEAGIDNPNQTTSFVIYFVK